MTIRGLILTQPPAPVKQQQDFPNGSPRLLNLLLSKDRLPFRQQDWPLPIPVKVNPALWGFTDSTRFKLIGKDALPFRQQEWPRPTPIPVNPALWGFTESTRIRLIGKDALPFRQLDWPSPIQMKVNPALLGFVDVSKIWLTTAGAATRPVKMAGAWNGYAGESGGFVG